MHVSRVGFQTYFVYYENLFDSRQTQFFCSIFKIESDSIRGYIFNASILVLLFF